MPGPHASVSLSANLKQQHPTPTTPATSASTRAGISRALKTARGLFLPRGTLDAGPGLFDSRTGHLLRPTPIKKAHTKKKALPQMK